MRKSEAMDNLIDAFRMNHADAKPKLCPDPETCTELHNDEDPETGEEHHYGCECGWCMWTYWCLKN